MDDLLSEFLTETNEGLTTLDMELVKLEQNPNDAEMISSIFRLMHTIKGTCGFLGLPRLESVAHAGENIMNKFRDKELSVTPAGVSLILECLDQIREILTTLEATEKEPEGDDSDLINRLNAHADGGDTVAVPEATPEETFVPLIVSVDDPDDEEDELEKAFRLALGPEELAAQAAAEAAAANPEPAPAVVEEKAPAPAPVAKTTTPAASPTPVKDKGPSVANQSIRVSVEVLENLMTMVSELVLTRNQTLQILRAHKESDFAAPLQRLNHVVSDLQEGVMKTRMQPIGNAWAKLPRIIRDLSHELDKKIDLVMKGAETELDRQVLELIKDPLTHMVRNSADHGLEMPDERLAAGKPETGQVVLNAFHEGGHIIIQISDDGKGLNTARIKEKCIESGLASENDMDGMNDQQVQQYIFKAGFSTAAEVTAVSGRGVGMDVVRTNIEKIGGTVELNSTEGKGTIFTIKIPLTLAIVSALIVECCKERFAIPQLSVVELVRTSAHSEHKIEHINETPVLRLRNRLLPLVTLRDLLRLSDDSETEVEDGETKLREGSFIVVAQVGTYSFGIIVDRVFDTEEIVVKPVAPILRHIQLFSGNTILGDGAVVMILDPNGIAAATGEIAVADDGVGDYEERQIAAGEEKVAMLVFRSGGGAPKAVPLALIARLEEIDLEKVESSGGKHVVQYRGQLMPLIPMQPEMQLEKEGRQPVLVFSDRERSMGLIVDEIIDIVEDRMNVELSGGKPGFIGSAIIAEKATDVVDAGYFLTQAFPDWFGSEAGAENFESVRTKVLLVDDSPFFRNLLIPLLSVAGYSVKAVESASEALALCEKGEMFDIIVSDIEMPGMNGFEFAEAVREDHRWASTPMVALSAYASPADLDRGRSAGFKDYVSKTDREALLMTLKDTISELKGAA